MIYGGTCQRIASRADHDEPEDAENQRSIAMSAS